MILIVVDFFNIIIIDFSKMILVIKQNAIGGFLTPKNLLLRLDSVTWFFFFQLQIWMPIMAIRTSSTKHVSVRLTVTIE